jgi:hypothetical protein
MVVIFTHLTQYVAQAPALSYKPPELTLVEIGVPDFQQFSDQHFSDDWTAYHAAMEPLRNRVAVTAAIPTVTAIAIGTSTAIAADPGLFNQLTSASGWIVAFIQGKVIDLVSGILTDPASLLHWTANEWTMLHHWLLHIEFNLIHLMASGIH